MSGSGRGSKKGGGGGGMPAFSDLIALGSGKSGSTSGGGAGTFLLVLWSLGLPKNFGWSRLKLHSNS